MADITLKTDYKDDVLDTNKNTQRKYQMIQNEDGTVSFVDVTEYSQEGDSFGSSDINATNLAIEELNSKLIKISSIGSITGNTLLDITDLCSSNSLLHIDVKLDNNNYYFLPFSAFAITSGARVYNAYGEYKTNKLKATIKIEASSGKRTVLLVSATVNDVDVLSNSAIIIYLVKFM